MKKKLSGAAYRRLRREASSQALEAQEVRAVTGDAAASAKRYARCGKPPAIETMNQYALQICGEALYQIANDAALDEPDRRAQIAALGDRIARLHPKAVLEAKVARISKHYNARTENAPTVDVRSTKGVIKNPEARGMSGPRALPPVQAGLRGPAGGHSER